MELVICDFFYKSLDEWYVFRGLFVYQKLILRSGTENCSNCCFGCFLGGPDVYLNDTSFQCQDGRWLSLESKCNSKEECLHGDDETGCRSSLPCDKSQFQCKSGECVEYQDRCNGFTNCWDKSDEIGCGWCSIVKIF